MCVTRRFIIRAQLEISVTPVPTTMLLYTLTLDTRNSKTEKKSQLRHSEKNKIK